MRAEQARQGLPKSAINPFVFLSKRLPSISVSPMKTAGLKTILREINPEKLTLKN
jgi:hypothetical protein